MQKVNSRNLIWLSLLGATWSPAAWAEEPNSVQVSEGATSEVAPFEASPPASSPPASSPPDAGSPASGQTPSQPTEEQREEAGERFRRGISFYEEGDYRLALIEFERAYQLVPNYRVLFNIGQVAISLGKFARARIALERYLAEGGAALDLERRAAVEKDLNLLRSRTATLQIEVAPAAVEAMVDDRVVGTSPFGEALILDAGEHRVRLTKKGFSPEQRAFTLAGGESLQLKVNLTKEPEVPATVVVERPKEPTQETEASPLKTARWVSWTATALFAGGALATGLVGAEQAGRLSDMKAGLDPDPAELERVSANAQTWLVTSDVLLIAAGTALGTSIFLQLYNPEKGKEAAKPSLSGVALFPTAGGLGLRGKF